MGNPELEELVQFLARKTAPEQEIALRIMERIGTLAEQKIARDLSFLLLSCRETFPDHALSYDEIAQAVKR